jgi:MFS family permease
MNKVDLSTGLEQAWTSFITFVPKLLLAIVILVVGYFVARLLCRLLGSLLERVGFDRLVERGGIKRALARTNYDASSLLGKVLFYAVMLFVLQFAFGIFGPNPISTLLTSVIAFLPNLFAAVLIVIVATAIAAAVKDILRAALSAVSYGRFLANLAGAVIVATGIFAALNQIHIAPAIVNGLFYAMLAVIAGSAIIAIGGGGIGPMRAQWEKALGRIEAEAPRLRAHATEIAETTQQRAETWKQEAERASHGESGEQRSFSQ